MEHHEIALRDFANEQFIALWAAPVRPARWSLPRGCAVEIDAIVTLS